MGKRVVIAVIAAVIAVSMLLLGLFVASGYGTPVARAADRPVLIPQDLSWQYVTSCVGDGFAGGGIISLSFGGGTSAVEYAEDTPGTRAAAERIEACIDAYDFEPRADGFSYVDTYERARLWDYYTAITVPCLAAEGVELDQVPREQFFVPDERPWNPYTAMEGIPFAELLALYRTCPPVPEYLEARHRP